MKPKRKLKKLDVKFVSLCKTGASKIGVILKSDDSVDFCVVSKADSSFNENGNLYSIVYAPELVDAQGDIADKEAILSGIETFAKSGFNVDIKHNGKAVSKEDAYITQSWMIEKSDGRFEGIKTSDGKDVPLDGAWAICCKILNPELKKAYLSGEWGGVSMGGVAQFEPMEKDAETKDSTLDKILSSINKLFGKVPESNEPLTKGDSEMTPEEIKTIVAETVSATIAAMNKSQDDVHQNKKDEEPKLDLTSVKDLKKFIEQKKTANLIKSIDLEDVDQLESLLAALEQKEAENSALRKSVTSSLTPFNGTQVSELAKSIKQTLGI